ncbi:transglutaminase-like domain-containing protein [Sulfitobacter guttiformis]|uniref:Transglutaminase superfamily protein n=1 Tax=Sulfitobacter guttiformis TaxID=74349 RepID=A0A420DT57_9RHOB|nr:transglutaminase family protein [Sulfitobacter guttiformis]KIN74865.1 Transglutaminase-like protein [Sulfitobacter guttiformis KCTC 32187]RKE97435.1 transglutaminase superfamily protein [Sulfitobacter guttiformis]
MRFLIRTHLSYAATQPCDLLLQIEAMQDAVQRIVHSEISFDPVSVHHNIEGEQGLGTRKWIEAGPDFDCHYQAQVEVTRNNGSLATLLQTPRTQIPANVVQYLMPSRYCHSELFLDFVSSEFGDSQGGVLVEAMRNWINTNFTYDNGASNAGTTASDSFQSLAGVCRDYAHVMIAFARAAGIPARFVSVYAPDVVPQDFHAVVEVYLDGGWHLLDPTGMAKPSDMVRICVGRDAADASFMTSYGWMDLRKQTVEVHRIAS